MSTMTDPVAMVLIASSVTSSGGRRPGTCAVVITTLWRGQLEVPDRQVLSNLGGFSP